MHLLKAKFSFKGGGGRGGETRSPLSEFSGPAPAEDNLPTVATLSEHGFFSEVSGRLHRNKNGYKISVVGSYTYMLLKQLMASKASTTPFISIT